MLEQPEASIGQGDVVHRLVWLLRVVNGLPKNPAQLSFDAFAGLLLQALRQNILTVNWRKAYKKLSFVVGLIVLMIEDKSHNLKAPMLIGSKSSQKFEIVLLTRCQKSIREWGLIKSKKPIFFLSNIFLLSLQHVWPMNATGYCIFARG